MQYTVDLDTVLHTITAGQKVWVVRFIQKHFVYNQDYIMICLEKVNKHRYLLTQTTYELLQSSYNLKNKFMPMVQNLKQISTIIMSLENQTIGFIHSAFSGIYNMKRQQREAPYYIDLVFLDHALALECDENGHTDRDQDYERERESVIAGKYMILRFNPNSGSFDLSLVIRAVMDVIVGKNWKAGVKKVGDRA